MSLLTVMRAIQKEPSRIRLLTTLTVTDSYVTTLPHLLTEIHAIQSEPSRTRLLTTLTVTDSYVTTLPHVPTD